MMMLIITREEAQEQGLTKYFTGKPCKHGHLAERYTVNTRCSVCQKDMRKILISKNPKKYKQQKKVSNKRYKTKNKEKVKEYQKRYFKKNPEKRLQSKEARKAYYEKTKHKRKTENLTPEQHEKKKAYARQWRIKDHAQRYKTDPGYRCNKLVRNILYRTLKASMKNKEGRTQDLLGYTAQEFRQHIERQFQKGMNWDNHGEWHIDHIHPISRFIEEGITDPKIINALSNLTPIWKTNNLSKGAKVTQLL